MIIAIDGPAAAGKGTLARRIASHFGLHYLDTGSIYRAVGVAVLDAGGDPGDEDAALKAARGLGPALAGDDRLRTARAGKAASIVAAIPAVRNEVLAFQRKFAARPPGAVLDGRDIGTVVCPDADVKLFVTASPAERARRRHAELLARGEPSDYDTVLAELEQRDARDRTRKTAPLEAASDAHLLDTSKLDIEAAFQAALQLIEASGSPGAGHD